MRKLSFVIFILLMHYAATAQRAVTNEYVVKNSSDTLTGNVSVNMLLGRYHVVVKNGKGNKEKFALEEIKAVRYSDKVYWSRNVNPGKDKKVLLLLLEDGKIKVVGREKTTAPQAVPGPGGSGVVMVGGMHKMIKDYYVQLDNNFFLVSKASFENNVLPYLSKCSDFNSNYTRKRKYKRFMDMIQVYNRSCH
jgi:hypothetical protein